METTGTQNERILFVSVQMRFQTWKALLEKAKFPPSQAAQKYNGLMAKGFAAGGAEVFALTPPPVSRLTSDRRFVRLHNETENGIRYRYLPIADLPVVRHAVIWLSSFFQAMRLLNGSAYVVCDALTVTAASGARLAAKLRHRPCIAIVTDVPEILGGAGLVSKLNMRALTRYDGYVLLTEAMDARVNPHHRPYLVAEGLVDSEEAYVENRSAEKYDGKTCLYAGMLHEKYGVLRLVEAFRGVKDENARLILYGTGDAADRIREAADADARIDYRGVADNRTVVDAERRAHLLVNPRPTDEEFVRYSFPSKNLEYMASGTPVLTTRLPGMPKEYEPFVYCFNGESVDAMRDTLEAVLALPKEVLHEKGASAKRFVLENKANTAVAGRVSAFLRTLAGRGERGTK